MKRIRTFERGIHKSYTNKKKITDIPGPKSYPMIGTLHRYVPFIGEYKFDELHRNGFKKLKEYGPIVKEEIVPGVHLVWLFKPEDIEHLFRSEGKYPHRRSHLALAKYRLDNPKVYNTGGLLPTNGYEWYRIRKAFQKGLSSPSAVKNFLSISDQIIQEWFSRLDDISQIPSVDYLPELSRLFLELTGSVALDIRLNSFAKEELYAKSRSSKLIRAAYETNSCILKTDNGPQLWRLIDTPLYIKLKQSQKFMEEVAIDLLSLKMSIFQDHKHIKDTTLLETYLQMSELDFKDIIGMVCDFLLAGIDTTTYSTSFLLYHLSKNFHVQSVLYDEAKKLLPNHDSAVTEEVLAQAQYAKAILKESFRLRPISVGIGRVIEDDLQLSGYNVPKGTVVVTQNQVTCRLKEYFFKPNEFKPERWLRTDPLYKIPDPFLVLPFGHGARSCIARRLAEQNMLILLLKLSRNYILTWNGSDLDSKSLLINKPDGPVKLILTKRK